MAPWRSLLLATTLPLAGAAAPCAQALLLVAHPDDETLFAGEALLGRAAALPGGCRNVAWHVVCATNDNVPQRRQDLRRALAVARSHSLAASVTEEAWDFADCNLPHCGDFLESASGADFREKLRAVLEQQPWDFVVTHNAQGEYHHLQHVGLHRQVLAWLQEQPGRRPELLVFNPLPELNVSMSVGKHRMVKAYLTGPAGVSPARLLLFEALAKYAEQLVRLEDFRRPLWPLGLCYLPGATQPGLPHFQYSWAAASQGGVDTEEWGDFKAGKALPLVDEMLKGLLPACEPGAAEYPSTCAALRRHAAGAGGPALQRWVEAMEGTDTESAAAEEAAGDETKMRRCLKTEPVGRFGSVTAWHLRGSSEGPVRMELLAIRPILVGWRQGFKGRTYKVLGSTGPLLVDLSAGAAVVRVPLAGLALQPHDVLGWGLPDARASASADTEEEDVRCLASACDEAGLCSFASPPPTSLVASLQSISVDMEEPAEAPGRLLQAAAPFPVRPALDISRFVEASTSYAELLTLRQRLDSPDLGIFEDKIRLRRELLPEAGVASTPPIFLSNTETSVLPHLAGREGFVVKPSHMSESQFVFVVQNGVNLLQQAWGHPAPAVTITEIQAAVESFFSHKALAWECRALLAVEPGVIVEELVLAEDGQGKLRVDEYKFFVVWGTVVFGENVPFSSGAAMEILRDGEVFSAKGPCPPFCVASCYGEMVRRAERVARAARADFLRVDLLVKGRCEEVYVSEVELFPASDFSASLKELVAQRWRAGYLGL